MQRAEVGNGRFWPLADPYFSGFWDARTSASPPKADIQLISGRRTANDP
jgi:hypothetical protein